MKTEKPNIECKEQSRGRGEPINVKEIHIKDGYVYIDGKKIGKLFVGNRNQYMSGKIVEFNISN